MAFSERLAQDGAILLDGATGSELERRGLKIERPLWSAMAFLTEEGRALLQSIHMDYIRAGAEIITSNTFRTNYRTLKQADLRHKSSAWTREAVESVRRAVDQSRPDHVVYVAGSVAPLEDCYHPERVPEDAELREEHRRHVDNLYEAGVDVILIETMNTIREAVIASDYAVTTGKPVMVSFVCRDDEHLLSGESLSHASKICAMMKVSGILVNCVKPSLLSRNLTVLRESVSVPIGGYANLLPEKKESSAMSPQEYAEWASGWVREIPLKLVGGCCGSTPDHIKALAEVIHAHA